MRPDRIYHIATPADADLLQANGTLSPPSLVAEGFVHCSTADQVVATTGRYFPPDAELVLVELDTRRVTVEIRWPEVYPGQHFPHVHGPLENDWVIGVIAWGPDDRARWPG